MAIHLLRDWLAQQVQDGRRNVDQGRIVQPFAGRYIRTPGDEDAVHAMAAGDCALGHLCLCQLARCLLPDIRAMRLEHIRIVSLYDQVGEALQVRPVEQLLAPPNLADRFSAGLRIHQIGQFGDDPITQRLVLGARLDDALRIAAAEVDPDIAAQLLAVGACGSSPHPGRMSQRPAVCAGYPATGGAA